MQDTSSFVFTLDGQIESRRALPPAGGCPRMEISFSGVLDSQIFGVGSGACTFEAEADADGIYAMQGFGTLFLATGFILFDVSALGRRGDAFIVYDGVLRLRSGNFPEGLLARLTSFCYRQNLATLAVQVQCTPWPVPL